MSFSKTLERLKQLRKNSGLTQKELAEKLNISLHTYSKMERGEIKLRAQLLLDIAHHLKVDPEFLFVGKYSKNYILYNCQSEETINIKITPQEKAVLNMLRELNNKDKDIVINVLDAIHNREHK